MKALVLLLSLFALGSPLRGQIQLAFLPSFQGMPLQLDHPYVTAQGDSVRIEALRFYISQVELREQGKTVWKESNSYHLIDLAHPESLHRKLACPGGLVFDQLCFAVGIDSSTNVSGAMGGDLDPTLGMYWAWQSGYINFKLEGQSPTCPSRKNRFQYHVGGYQGDFASLQQLQINCTPQEMLPIDVAIDQLLARLDLSSQYQIMDPGTAAVELAGYFPQVFRKGKP